VTCCTSNFDVQYVKTDTGAVRRLVFYMEFRWEGNSSKKKRLFINVRFWARPLSG